MDLDFVPSVAFISDVYIADSLRARILINLSAVLLRVRTLINLSIVLYEQERTALPAKRIKTNKDCKKDNIEELICVGKVKHTYVLFRRAGNNRNNLNIMVTNPTGREFSRVDMKSLTRLCLLIDGAKLYCKRKWAYNIGKFYKGLTPRELGSIYVLRIISKSDKVPTRELSSYIKTELYPHQKLCDNSRKFYRLVITSEDTHCKQIIKKAYIMSLERALLILFIT
ncbi:hypothetical protein HBI71_245450 [Parastagonospora nodorum]|nr:hypothetical protein HBI71_245450 [Parastagonospora nodorum]